VTDFSRYTAYCCRLCREPCLNRRGSPEARASECRHCASVTALEDAPTREATERTLPEGAPATEREVADD
jgi:hypothetical protein